MAKTAHTTPTPAARTAPLPGGVTSRRGLALGATALATAGLIQAAPVASPDAELIRLCEATVTADRLSDEAVEAVNDCLPSHPRYRAALALSDQFMADYQSNIERAVEIPATTPEGLRAKSQLVLCHLRSADDAEIALSLARDVLAGRA